MPNITMGMQGALSKLPGSGYKCPECGFVVPKYTGRYPGKCSNCDTELLKESGMSKAREIIEQLSRVSEGRKDVYTVKDFMDFLHKSYKGVDLKQSGNTILGTYSKPDDGTDKTYNKENKKLDKFQMTRKDDFDIVHFEKEISKTKFKRMDNDEWYFEIELGDKK